MIVQISSWSIVVEGLATIKVSMMFVGPFLNDILGKILIEIVK